MITTPSEERLGAYCAVQAVLVVPSDKRESDEGAMVVEASFCPTPVPPDGSPPLPRPRARPASPLRI